MVKRKWLYTCLHYRDETCLLWHSSCETDGTVCGDYAPVYRESDENAVHPKREEEASADDE